MRMAQKCIAPPDIGCCHEQVDFWRGEPDHPRVRPVKQTLLDMCPSLLDQNLIDSPNQNEKKSDFAQILSAFA